jgi:molecular chaperone HscC
MAFIGIDLGTTNSLCAIFEDGLPLLIPNSHGNLLTPSVVGSTKDDQILVGEAALELRINKPERAAWCFKRNMGTTQKTKLGSFEFSAPELSSLVLSSLKEDAEKYLDAPVKDAVITVPAYFNEHQRKATILAGEMAGLNVLRVINEPTAAALSYGFQDKDAEKNLLVFDLGGGTFDVTAMEVFEGTLEIKATAGESFLGGEDFTERLVSLVLKEMNLNIEVVERKYPKLGSRLLNECEQAKKLINGREEVNIRLPDKDGNLTTKNFCLTKEILVDSTKDLMTRLRAPIVKVLGDSQLSPEDIDDIILVGGSTRMDLIKDFVTKYFKKEPLCKFNPDQVVALGAAIQTALIRDDKAVEDIVMTDVCPFTLGTEIVKTYNGKEQYGYFLPIIHRNTTIPVSKEEVLSTLRDFQTSMSIEIYQGEARKVKDNILLGVLDVKGIPRQKAGAEVHVRYSYDLNGILEVEAYVPDSHKRFQTIITNSNQNMSKKEIKEAVKNLQKVKFYPRDNKENQKLLLYAERIVGEIDKFRRETLEYAIDHYESGFSSGDKEAFESCRQDLLMTLSELGVPYQPGES